LVRRIRGSRTYTAGAAALAACAIAVAGCGGGDDSTTTSAGATVPQVTTPGQFNPNSGSTATTPKGPNSTTTAPPRPGNVQPGAQPVQQALAPFRDCLSKHGVSLPLLDGAGTGLQQARQRDPRQYRVQIQKAFVCIPELPPMLRQRAEEFKRRFEQSSD
jgi:hypothetical protein